MLTILAVSLSLLAPVHADNPTGLADQQLVSPVQSWGWTIGGGTTGLLLGGTLGMVIGSAANDPSRPPILLGLEAGLLTGLAGAGIGYLADTGHGGVATGIVVGGVVVVGLTALGIWLLVTALEAAATTVGNAFANTPSFL